MLVWGVKALMADTLAMSFPIEASQFLFLGLWWDPNGEEVHVVMGLLLDNGSNRWDEDNMGCCAHGEDSWLRF